MLWQRFRFPTPDGSVDAVAVPAKVHAELNSAYTIMVSSIIVNIWAIIIGCGLYYYLRGNTGDSTQPDAKKPDTKKDGAKTADNRVTDISMSVWNKRASPLESLLDTVLYARDDVKEWWFWPLIIVIIVVLAAKIAAGVLIPKDIFIGNGAPVNPASIFVPSQNYSQDDRLHLSATYALDVPAALRATGSALVANSSLQSQVHVGQPVILGQYSTNQSVQRIEYSYNVSGADMGLQHFPDLLLIVTGACTTDYTWYNTTQKGADYYYPWGNQSLQYQYVSVDDGTAPTAVYVLGDVSPTGPPGNVTWGALVSSVDRGSFTVGTDPWYLTTPTPGYDPSNPTLLPNTIMHRRPALSCWENDVWSYRGATSDIAHLAAPRLPGLALSEGLQNILTRYLGSPKIVAVAQRLNPSSLQSATTALGLGFDAASSSMRADLQRLVLASYIATVNTLTDTTLYFPQESNTGAPTGAKGQTAISNIAVDSLGVPLPGIGDFVVYSADVVTLSVKSLIVIPVITAACWIVMLLLLHFTPLKKANSLEVIPFFQDLRSEFKHANVYIDKTTKKARWFL